MKSKRGFSMIWVIVILLLVLFAAAIVAAIGGFFTPIYQTGIKYAEQGGVAAKIVPQSWYNVEITDAIQGEITFTVQNKNTSNYETDVDPTVGYKVYDQRCEVLPCSGTGTQTTVLNVKEFPVAYIAVVVDNATTSKFDNNFWSNLTKIKFAEANVAIIPVTDVPADRAQFKKSDELADSDRPTDSSKQADYWSALAAASNSLPTVQAKRNLGLNFLAIILVSEGRNDIISDKDTEKITSALNTPPDTHFYMLRSSCDIPWTNGADVQQDVSNATLEGYKAAVSVLRADCYTNASALFDDLLVKDLAPIIMEYEPVKPAVYAGDMKFHNITVEVTKRTGVLGTEAAYSGKGSTPPGIMQKY
jgi:hypothetical protein